MWPGFQVLDTTSLWNIINIHHAFHPLRLSPCPKKKKNFVPLLKTVGVCFKTAFKTCHCEGETKCIVLQTPCPILPDILTNWQLFTDTLLICTCKERASIFNQTWNCALGFVPLWYLPLSSTASGLLFTFPLFNTIWFSSAPDNPSHLWGLASLCISVSLLLHHLTGLCSRPPPALLVCLLHLSMHVGKMCVARGMDSSFKTCTTPSLVGVQSPSIAKLAEK